MGKVKKPKVSVIVAAHNQERFIGRCLRSLLCQSFPQSDYEVIVVDDGSDDRTSYAVSQFIDPFESTIKMVKNDRNLGLPHSLNRGLIHAEAEWVVRVDADDYVNSNFLYCLYLYADSNSVSAVACDYVLVDDNENVLRRCCSSIDPIACGVIFKKDCLFEIGLYDEQFLSNEDKDLRLRFEKKYRVEHLKLPLYRYRRHDRNMTNDTKRMTKFDIALKNKHGL